MNDRENAVIREELDGVLADLVIRHDVLPFMMDMHAAAEMKFKPIPDPMLALIVASPDYQPVVAGADPTDLIRSTSTIVTRTPGPTVRSGGAA